MLVAAGLPSVDKKQNVSRDRRWVLPDVTETSRRIGRLPQAARRSDD